MQVQFMDSNSELLQLQHQINELILEKNELAKQNQSMLSNLESTPIPFVHIDKQYKITFLNKEFEQIFPHSKSINLPTHLGEILGEKNTAHLVHILDNLSSVEYNSYELDVEFECNNIKKYFKLRFKESKVYSGEYGIWFVPQDELLKHKYEATEYQKNFERLFDDIPVPLVIVNKDGLVIKNNKATRRFLKIDENPSQEIFTLNFYQNKNDREFMLSKIKSDGIILDFPIKLVDTQNNTVNISLNVCNTIYQNQNVFVGSLIDKSDEIQVNTELTYTHNLYNTLFNNTLVGFVVTDNDLIIESANDTFCNLLGMLPNEIIGQKFTQFSTKIDAKFEIENFSKIYMGLNDSCYLDSNIKIQQKEIWTRTLITALRDESGKVIKFLCLIEDITHQNHVSQQYETLSVALENSPSGVIVTNAVGEIIHVNQMFTKITGYSKTEVVGKKPSFFKSGSHSLGFYQHLWNTITDKKIWKGTFYNKRKDGTLYWEQASIAPILNNLGEIVQFVAIKNDISEQIQAQEALRFMHDHINMVIEHIPLLIAHINIDKTLIYANRRLITTMNIPETRIKNKYDLGLNSNFDFVFEKDIASGEVIKFEYELTNILHQVETHNITIIPQKDNSENEVSSFIFISENITSKKLKDKELIMLKKAVDYNPASILITDTKGIINYVNFASINTSGYSNEEMVGNNVNILKSNFHQRDFYEALWKTIISGSDWHGEILNLNKYGSFYWEEVLISAIKDNTNIITGFIAIKLDITDRKEMEKALSESEEKFRQMAENIEDVFFLMNPDMSYIYISPYFSKIFGRDCDELLLYKGKLIDWIHELDRGRFLQQMAQFEATKASKIELQFRIITDDNTEKWIWYKLNPIIDLTGNLIRIAGSIYDITEIKRIQLKLEQNEKTLKELNHTKDKFFSIIAHDLKNPFNTLIGFSELLIRTHHKLSEEKKLKYYDSLYTASKSGYELLVNLLTWSRSQTGKIQFSPELLSVSDLLHETETLFREGAAQKQISVLVETDPNHVLWADKEMIRTVLRNLVSNAIKFTPKNGNIILWSFLFDNTLEIAVYDDGVGIPEKNISQLFSIENSQTTNGTNGEKGTGLGLVLCKEFVEQNKGTITVESIPGKGSKFVMIFSNLDTTVE